MNIRKLSLVTLLAGSILAATSAVALASSAEAVVDLNVRDEAFDGDIIDVLYDGEVVDVLGCDYGWCFIDHKGPDGWVSAAYLDFDWHDDYYYYDYDDYHDEVDVEFGFYGEDHSLSFAFEISN